MPLVVFEEIRMAVDRLTHAYNSGKVNTTEFYTEDCILTVPGHEKLIGKRRMFIQNIIQNILWIVGISGIQEIYKHPIDTILFMLLKRLVHPLLQTCVILKDTLSTVI